MRVFLLGFKSTGKTTTGKKLANRLEYKFIDLDDQIELMDGRTVPEIFTSEGEQIFREKEREALIEVCNKENVVISTGGGAPCWFSNMDLMVEKGETVYLMLENETLVGRLKVAAKDRPIVLGKTSEELHQYVHDLKEKFEHHYLKAKHHIDTTGLNTGELVDKIEKALGNADN